jgi:DNA-binding SARP family transcriptional activator
MPRFELSFLGPATVRVDGQELALRTRKALALIAYLALENGHQSREQLTALFWSDAQPEAGRNSLRNTLSGLRENVTGLVIADRLLVRLEASQVWLDAVQLEQTADSVRFETASVSDLEAVAALYRGEFLQGLGLADADGFEAWLLERRGFYRRQFETVLEHLTVLHERQGQAIRALEVAERWLALDRVNEVAVRRVMALRFNAGNRSGALEAFEAFRTVLRDELGVEPTPETLSLAEKLRLETNPVQKARNPRLPSLPTLLLEGRMVGRVSEFIKLVEAYHASAQGQPRMVVISGEPGIGKTRLATEFLNWASGQGASLLRGRAYETGGGLAYQPITDAMRRALRSEAAARALLSPIWLSELSRLLPELLERFPELPQPGGDVAVARTRLFEAVTRLGLNQAARGPLVVFIDDLQWADEASLELLAYAVRRWCEEEATVLLVLTARSENLAASSQLQAWLTALTRELPLLTLGLEALSIEDTARLVETIAGASPTFANWLHTQTGGQPLFISETLKSLAERDLITPDANGWRIVPQTLEGHDANRPGLEGTNVPGVRAVIEARFSRLSPDARALLEAGAVLGQAFDFERLRDVADLEERAALDALDELLRSRLLLETASLYAFSHDRVRETAYDGAGDARRRVYHRRAHHGLLGTKVSPADLARHALAAHLWLEGFQACVLAGDQATAVYAWRESAEHYGRARKILFEQPDGFDVSQHLNVQEVLNVYGKLVNSYRTLNEWQPIDSLPDEILELSHRLESPWMEAHAYLFKAQSLDWVDLQAAVELREQARQIFVGLNDQKGLFEIKLVQVRGLQAHQQQATEPVIAKLEHLLPTAREIGLAPHEWVLSALAEVHQAVGQWARAVTYWQDLMVLRQDGKSGQGAYVFENLGLCQLNVGDLVGASPNLLEAYRIKIDIDDNPTWIGMAACYRSYGLLESGAIAQALELTELTFTVLSKATSRHAAEFGLALGMARIAAGKYELARAPLYGAVRQILELGETEQQIYGRSFRDFLESHLCVTYALEGDWLRACEHAKTALDLRLKTNNERGLHAPRLKHWLEVEALLRGGEVALAHTLAQRLQAVVIAGERLEISLLRAQAALEIWNRQEDTARRHWQRALLLSKQFGLPLEQREIEQALTSETRGVDEPPGAKSDSQ